MPSGSWMRLYWYVATGGPAAGNEGLATIRTTRAQTKRRKAVMVSTPGSETQELSVCHPAGSTGLVPELVVEPGERLVLHGARKPVRLVMEASEKLLADPRLLVDRGDGIHGLLHARRWK